MLLLSKFTSSRLQASTSMMTYKIAYVRDDVCIQYCIQHNLVAVGIG